MRQPYALRFAIAAVTLLSAAVLGAAVGCGPNQSIAWICLNPVTGKESQVDYDVNHYVNGMFDPCHCYDPCGPEKSCPIMVDAGPPSPDAMCEAADESDAGDAGGW
jgi:hypothetical protein